MIRNEFENSSTDRRIREKTVTGKLFHQCATLK